MSFNGTMTPGVAPPSGFLFRPAHPAALPLGGFIGVSLRRRDSIGPVCASTEAKCAQGDWCCDIGNTCSVVDGAFLCCPPGASGPGCARVCAAGDFQCGSICCAEKQTCGGRDTPSPFCINNPTSSSTFSTASTTSLSSTTSLAPTPTTAVTTTPPSLSSTPGLAFPSPTSPPETAPTATPTASHAPSSDTGLPLSAQITMGVLVPVLVILLVVGLWFCLFRRPARRRREIDDDDMAIGGGRGHSATHRRPATPPPAYTKTEIVVGTTSQGYTFSRARSPGEGHEMETLRRPGLAVSTEGQTRASLGSRGSGSPTRPYRDGVSRLDV